MNRTERIQIVQGRMLAYLKTKIVVSDKMAEELYNEIKKAYTEPDVHKLRISRWNPYDIVGILKDGTKETRLDSVRKGLLLRKDIMMVMINGVQHWVDCDSQGNLKFDEVVRKYITPDDMLWLSEEAFRIKETCLKYPEMKRIFG
jgi:hypothetical protein